MQFFNVKKKKDNVFFASIIKKQSERGCVKMKILAQPLLDTSEFLR